jgi:hypothetical protein
VPLFARLHARFFADERFDAWVDALLAELRQVGALRVEGDAVVDH